MLGSMGWPFMRAVVRRYLVVANWCNRRRSVQKTLAQPRHGTGSTRLSKLHRAQQCCCLGCLPRGHVIELFAHGACGPTVVTWSLTNARVLLARSRRLAFYVGTTIGGPGGRLYADTFGPASWHTLARTELNSNEQMPRCAGWSTCLVGLRVGHRAAYIGGILLCFTRGLC